MYLTNAADASGIDVTGIIFGLSTMIIATVIVLFLLKTYADYRKAKLTSDQDEKVRQLVNRYEQLAESTLDAQQRVATELTEVRGRVTNVEQFLRTVDGG
jgi:hypothetical protein